MSSKTKIIVLHKREVVYTSLFALLGIVIVFLLFFMFSSGSGKQEEAPQEAALYQAGVYTASIQLGDQTVDVEVAVDSSHINSISLVSLDDTVSARSPLVQPALDELSQQICESQSLDNISYPADSQYTSMVLLDAIRSALSKAKVPQ